MTFFLFEVGPVRHAPDGLATMPVGSRCMKMAMVGIGQRPVAGFMWFSFTFKATFLDAIRASIHCA
jgi:hypothetical protein